MKNKLLLFVLIVTTFISCKKEPSDLILFDLSKDQGKITLNWSEFNGSDFVKYDIYRSSNCDAIGPWKIASITDKETTSFVDSFPEFKSELCYFIYATYDKSKSIKSNNQIIDNPSGDLFDFGLCDIVKHPSKDILYINHYKGGKIIKFDLITLEILAEVNIPGGIGKMAIGDNGFGLEIYVPSENHFVYILDPEDLSQIEAYDTGFENHHQVIITGKGQFITSVYGSLQFSPIRVYSRATGLLVDESYSTNGKKPMLWLPEANAFVVYYYNYMEYIQ